MAENFSADELGALRQSFVMLTRNLFTYGQEGGVFSASNELEKSVTQACTEGLTTVNQLSDRCSDLLNQEHQVAVCGSFKPEYTFWTYRSQTSMLPLYLKELHEHYQSFIKFAEILESQEHSPNQGVLDFLKTARQEIANCIHKFNNLAKTHFEITEIDDPNTNLVSAEHDEHH